ncbi:DUF6994 family protein [Brevibacterium sp. GP-SGM9]|uniref:DUF6994 family protein n=1 Tax=Brevibacterium sp. GP-SGM9 TaxID=3376990 RepID=UPI0039A4EFE6
MINLSSRQSNSRAATSRNVRDVHYRIASRIDLPLECVRRHHRGETNLLASAPQNCAILSTFSDPFSNYVELFQLHSL